MSYIHSCMSKSETGTTLGYKQGIFAKGSSGGLV